ncbi:MAG: ABC transporter permease [Anaerolineales bacterium]
MIRYAIRRLLQAIPTMFGITIITYFIMASAPGSPATQLTLNPELTVRQRNAMAEAMGVNMPVYEQYARWMIGDKPISILGVKIWDGREMPVFDPRGNQIGTQIGDQEGLLRGDFGRSLVSRRPVTEIIQNRLWPTVELGALSLLIGTTIGIPVGVLAAVNQGGIFDQVTRIMAVIVSAVPVFWLGLILLLIFGSWLELLPMGNRRPASISGDYTLAEIIPHYILPVFTLSSFTIATFSRFTRASVLDVLNQDYVRTARAKGLQNTSVWFTHATRNALIPIATLIGPALPGVIAGAVLTETIYAWPGMGRLVLEAIQSQDYPVVMAVTLMFSVATIIGYLISDLLYAVLDPRIRLN